MQSYSVYSVMCLVIDLSANLWPNMEFIIDRNQKLLTVERSIVWIPNQDALN